MGPPNTAHRWLRLVLLKNVAKIRRVRGGKCQVHRTPLGGRGNRYRTPLGGRGNRYCTESSGTGGEGGHFGSTLHTGIYKIRLIHHDLVFFTRQNVSAKVS